MRGQVEHRLLAAVDVGAKGLLAFSLVLVLVDPTWGNLEGKAPTFRALVYPLVAAVVPLWSWVGVLRSGRPRAYPWLADLLLTTAGFGDILGNRLDLFDKVVWFDDFMHFAVACAVCSAALLVTADPAASYGRLLERSIAVAMSAGVLWEIVEYFAFVTRSPELPTAYADTVGDLTLAWLGSVTAATLVHLRWRPHVTQSLRPSPRASTARARQGSP